MAQFTHLLMTRFNLRTKFGGGVLRDAEWHRHRFGLFETFCLPSVRGQRDADFKWIVFFDRETDAVFRERIAGYAEWDRFTPYYIDALADAKYQAVRDHLLSGASHLITTRLDTDDAIGTNYLAAVQDQFSGQDLEFINFPNGYVLNTNEGKLYTRRAESNAFISLIERAADFRTVYCGGHKQLETMGPYRSVDADPSWLVVVHDKNSSTRGRKHMPAATRRVLDHDFTIEYTGT